MISSGPVQRSRSRKQESDASFRSVTNYFCVCIKKDDSVEKVDACKTAFLSIHGIGLGKLNHLLQKMKDNPDLPRDMRGRHQNHPHKLDEERLNQVCDHIKSFKTCSSHYSLKKLSKVYLGELNISKMYDMFKKFHFGEEVVSYETYRTIFNRDFNISFGNPHTDSCSCCDVYKAQHVSLHLYSCNFTN